MNANAGFVKSATTTTPVAKTQADIIAMLNRYGASGFGFRRIGDVVSVTFHISSAGVAERSVEIPVNLSTVAARLDSPELQEQRRRQRQAARVDDAQAERVAWRVLYLWIDAALSAVSLGAQSIEEAFFAHMIVETTDGHRGRLVDYVGTLGLAGGGRLPSPSQLRLGRGEDD